MVLFKTGSIRAIAAYPMRHTAILLQPFKAALFRFSGLMVTLFPSTLFENPRAIRINLLLFPRRQIAKRNEEVISLIKCFFHFLVVKEPMTFALEPNELTAIARFVHAF